VNLIRERGRHEESQGNLDKKEEGNFILWIRQVGWRSWQGGGGDG